MSTLEWNLVLWTRRFNSNEYGDQEGRMKEESVTGGDRREWWERRPT